MSKKINKLKQKTMGTLRNIAEHVKRTLLKENQMNRYYVVMGAEVNMDKAYFWSGMVFHTRRAAERRLATLNKLRGKRGVGIGTMYAKGYIEEDDVMRIDHCSVASRVIDLLTLVLDGRDADASRTVAQEEHAWGLMCYDKEYGCHMWSGWPMESYHQAGHHASEYLNRNDYDMTIVDVRMETEGLWTEGENIEKSAWIKEEAKWK